MSAAVKLTSRAARNVDGALAQAIDWLEHHADPEPGRNHLLNLLRAARTVIAPPAPRPKSSQVRKTEAKRRAKVLTTRAIYMAVEKRAGGRCECCGAPFTRLDPPELDHQLLRGKAQQSVENCWMLRRSCHRARTDNKPSAAHWWTQIIGHARLYGHAATEREARGSLAEAEFKSATRGGAR